MSQVYLCFAAPDLSPKWGGELPFPLGKGTGVRSAWLTPREARMLAEIESPRRRRDWLAGRWAAKELIRDYLLEREGLAPARALIEILNDENGAPKVLFPLNLEISIAHSGGHGLAGLCAHSPLGVDLQQIRPVRSDLVERVLTERERAQLAQQLGERYVETEHLVCN